jgi:hypothetical protein
VFWECYFFANGAKPEAPGVTSFFTDYGLKIYSVPQLYVYKCIFKGGMNHMISTKQVVGTTRIDDCVFACWNSAGSTGFNIIELGQEGTPTDTSDYTNGFTEIRGCTFAAANSNVVVWFKEATGMLLDGCIFYKGATFITAGFFRTIHKSAGTKAWTYDVNEDRGILAGSQNLTISNNKFRGTVMGTLGTPGPVNLYRLFKTAGHGTFTFIARNNQTSGTRNVSVLTTGVTVDANTATRTNTGFI